MFIFCEHLRFSSVFDADVFCDNSAGAEGKEGAAAATDAGTRLRHSTSSSQQHSFVQAEKEMLLICFNAYIFLTMLMFTRP